MIKKLRTRKRIDKFENQVRSTRTSKGRFLYLFMLGCLAFFVLKVTMGPSVIFSADGLVMKEEHVVSTLFQARVAEVFVKEGQKVKVGQPLLRNESATVLREIADLTTRVANLTTRAAQIKTQAEATEAVLPVAEWANRETKREVENLDKLKRRSLVTDSRFNEALSTRYESQARYEKLKAEKEALTEEISKIEEAKAEAVDGVN